MATPFSRRLQRLLALGRYGFPFSFRAPGSQMMRLRRHNLRERFRTRGRIGRWALLLFCTAGYPIFTALEVRRNLSLLRRREPAAGAGAALRMYSLAMTGNVPPVAYVFYNFEDPLRRALWPEYLYWTDRDAVKMLNRLRGANPDDVQDKVRFAQICAEHGLPHAEVLADFRGGVAESREFDRELPEDAELWVKPVGLQGGVGAECWRRKDGVYESTDGRLLTRQEYVAHLRIKQAMVQRRLVNHPEVDAITNGWLATLRIVVALRRDGSTALLGNGVGLPRGSGITSARGLVGAIRWDDGVIFQVQEPSAPWQAAAEDICHQDTGQRVVGTRIPFWRESLELVQKAHRIAFPGFATLGWDVALTPEGPVLLEANSGWGEMHLQSVFGPLGKTVLSQIVAEEMAD